MTNNAFDVSLRISFKSFNDIEAGKEIQAMGILGFDATIMIVKKSVDFQLRCYQYDALVLSPTWLDNRSPI